MAKKNVARNKPKHSKQMSGNQRTSQRKVTPQHRNAIKRKSSARKNNTLLMIGGVLLIIVLSASAILLGNRQNSLAANALPEEISVEEAYQKYEEGAFVLDVRTAEEWDAYHAPDTTLIPLDELPNRLDEIPQGEEIVVVCRSGNRSQEGRDILLNAGFNQVTSMAGGLNAWGAAGFPLDGQYP